ncbi:hypothetical protein J3U56_11840 [Gilliamella sp. B2824]|uniref:hypothetical protein n=1 Tax=Gilliamella sp. B2824 TaxID=2818019 RepID=UPI00226990F0|nr:hypothetical protein [Gilliamella sp. B2824]MCX8740015.1 hypothetical protein [Gilliamella sp. B2824]
MKLDNLDNLFEHIEKLDKNQGISNFNPTNVNYPKNPYTQLVYQAEDLYKYGHQKGFSETRWLTEHEIQTHNLQIKQGEKDNFFESDLYKDNEKLRNIKFYNVEQLDKASFDKLPPEIKPEKQWQENLKIEQFIETGVNNSPTLIKREVNTNINLNDGDIVVLGGLTDSKDSNAKTSVGFLPFFNSKSDEKNKTDILVALSVSKIKN